MTTPTWRDLAGQPPQAPAGPAAGGQPVTWRDLQAGPQAPQPGPANPWEGFPQAPQAPQAAPQGYQWPGTGVQLPPPAQQAPQAPPAAPQGYPVPPPPSFPQAPAPAAAPAYQPPPAGVVGDGGWQVPAAQNMNPATPQFADAAAVGAPADPADASAALGMNIAAAGGSATDVDAGQLLAQIRTLEARLNAFQANYGGAAPGQPEAVKYATALADHLQSKADANPHINTDPENTYYPALVKAAQLVNATQQVTAANGQGKEHLVTMARDIEAWVKAHARKFRALDYEYVLQLVEEVGSAAAKIGL